MSDDRTSGSTGDPEKRAFGGGADMPPGQPDQPEEGNEELLREPDQGGGATPDKQQNPHGDYPNLPGYGG